jgi:putative N6-adenine-specific DNA methylase
MHLKGYNDAIWENLRKEARGKIQKTIGKKIIAGDINPEAIEAARINSRLAGVEKYIDFVVGDYRQTPLPNDKNIIMFNPGYGIRLQEAKKLELTYKEIGDFLKQKCAGSTGYIFSGNLSLLKKVGLKAGRKMIFFNGPIECRLCEYEIYQNASQ